MRQHLVIEVCVGLALLMSIYGIIHLTELTLTVEGNDIAQAGILIGILGTVCSGILGFMSGVVLGRHFDPEKQKKLETIDPPD